MFGSLAFFGASRSRFAGTVDPGAMPSLAAPFFGVDAEAASTLSADTAGTTPAVPDGGVARIADAFGTGKAFTQGVASAQATLVGGAVNGRRALRFPTAGGRYYRLPTTGNPGNALRGDWTMAVAYVPRFTGQTREHVIFRAGDDNPTGNLRVMGVTFSQGTWVWRHTDADYVWAGATGFTPVENQVVFVVARYSRANGLRFRAVEAGGNREGFMAAGADAVDDVDWPNVQLGANVDATGNPVEWFSGDICELRVWGSEATDQQVTQLLDYLSLKWAGNVVPPVVVEPPPPDPEDPPPPTGSSGVPPPNGWGLAFEDTFQGTSLNTSNWNIVYHNGQSGNNQIWWDNRGVVVDNGVLRLRAWTENGQWYGGGLQEGNRDTGKLGYGDWQVEVEMTIPAARGAGVYAVMWPIDPIWPPEFDIVETPSNDKQSIMVTWHWPGPNGEDKAHWEFYPVNATRRIKYIARRIGDNFWYWTQDVATGVVTEHETPVEWPSNPYRSQLVLGIAMFVSYPDAAWYGYGPDWTTPDPYEVLVHSARIYAPGATGTPTDPPPTNTRSLSLSPQAPGTLTEDGAGLGVVWPVTVVSSGLSQVSWVVVKADYGWRSEAQTVATSGSVQIQPRLMATGDFVLVFDPADSAFQAWSEPVTIQARAGATVARNANSSAPANSSLPANATTKPT